MESEDTLDVVQTVVESEGEFLIAKRSRDSYWEFMGGKVKKGEDLEEAALRELNEETDLKLQKKDTKDFRRGDSYRSSADSKYRLNPVHFRISEEKKKKMTEEGLSREHTDFQWIDLTRFDEFETLGQYQALENPEIVNGRVALAVVEKDGEYLVVKRSEENSSAGKWGAVSGKIEAEENVEEAAKRELNEETGLKAEIIGKADFYIGKGEKGYWRLEPVLMKYVSGEVNLNWELSDFQWIKPEEAKNLDTMGRMKGLEKLDILKGDF
jgi:8-oxo-dGTP pyrophosphatase MutT (NUDIX family)